VVVSCLRDAAVIRETFLDDDGAAASGLRAEVVIEHATVDLTTSRAVAAALAARGIHYVDAPVSEGRAGAAAGTLMTMRGGTDEAVAAARPYLEMMCARLVHVGEPGTGVAVKLVNQLLVAAHSVAAAEAAAVVRSLGVDPDVTLEALMGGWAASKRLELQFTDGVRGAVQPDGAGLAKFIKDLELVDEALDGASVASTPMPAVRRTWEAAAGAHPDAGFAALTGAYAPPLAPTPGTSNNIRRNRYHRPR
jgi:3-hydroxyisobutyrate dehydrogenase-like beta-hydroxyacid dehydrogenase